LSQTFAEVRGRLRTGTPEIPPPYSNPVSSNTYARVWRLNAGVPATQVAEWAGHSLNVLLKVYAKCLDGQDEVARQRVEAALKETPDERAA
jgi:hypothetical protein